MTVVKIEKEKAEKLCHLILKIIKTVQKQLNLIIKQIIQKKSKINVDSFFYYKIKHKEFIKNKKVVLKTQQRFKSERYNFFTKEINKIALSSNDEKKNAIDWFDRKFAYGTRKDIASEKEEIKCNNTIKRYKNN